jgi:hypothetical protein
MDGVFRVVIQEPVKRASRMKIAERESHVVRMDTSIHFNYRADERSARRKAPDYEAFRTGISFNGTRPANRKSVTELKLVFLRRYAGMFFKRAVESRF